MKAIVFHGVGDIGLDDVPEPGIEDPHDAVVRLTASAICGTDLHFVRGTVPGMQPGTVLGHEGVGVVEEVGSHVRNLKPGDRVVIPSTVACGTCAYCRAGYYAQCDNAGNGSTAFYGGPAASGPYQGLQAEFARVPFANVGLVKLPDSVSDDQAILLSDVAPTGWFGAELAEVSPGDTVAVLGAGPVGQFAIEAALHRDAARVIAIDRVQDRLEVAREAGAEIVDFDREDPVEMVREMTRGIGVDRVIDAVGVDAEQPAQGPGAHRPETRAELQGELGQVSSEAREPNGHWGAGDAPSQALRWSVDAVAKAGTVGVIGVYPETADRFPIGAAMNRNLTVQMGNCNHRRYVPGLVRLVEAGALHPEKVLSRQEPVASGIDAYRQFDLRRSGWLKVELKPSAAASRQS
jgi:threonine dehydrogenase-like Zn-dependent dehydrogenase